jgi:hypothetical protein
VGRPGGPGTADQRVAGERAPGQPDEWAAGQTLTKRLPTSVDVVDVAAMLLDKPGLNSVGLRVDCGV